MRYHQFAASFWFFRDSASVKQQLQVNLHYSSTENSSGFFEDSWYRASKRLGFGLCNALSKTVNSPACCPEMP